MPPPSALGGWPLPQEFGGAGLQFTTELHAHGAWDDVHLLEFASGSLQTPSGGGGLSVLGGFALRSGVPAARFHQHQNLAFFLYVHDPKQEAGTAPPSTREDWREAFSALADSSEGPDRGAIDAAVAALEPASFWENRGGTFLSEHFLAFPPALDAATAGFVLGDDELMDRCARRLAPERDLWRAAFVGGVPEIDSISPPGRARGCRHHTMASASARSWLGSLAVLLGAVSYADAMDGALEPLGYTPGLWDWDRVFNWHQWCHAPRILSRSEDQSLIAAVSEAALVQAKEAEPHEANMHAPLLSVVFTRDQLGRTPAAREAWSEVRQAVFDNLGPAWP